MNTVTRDPNGKIDKIEVTRKVWLTPKDYEVFCSHIITTEELENFCGDDGKKELLQLVVDVVNEEYNAKALRCDILQYNELISF